MTPQPQPPQTINLNDYQPIQVFPQGAINLKDYQDAPTFGQKLEAAQRNAAPIVGRLLGESLPFVGSFIGPEGTVGGAAAETLLKSYAPSVFGEAPKNIPDLGMTIGKDVLLNNILPGAFSKALSFAPWTGEPRALLTGTFLRNFPSIRSGAIKNLTEQEASKMNFPETGIIETGSENAFGKYNDLQDEILKQYNLHPPSEGAGTQFYHPDLKAAIKDMDDTFNKNKIGQQMIQLHKQVLAGDEVAGAQTYKSISKAVMSDVQQVKNAQLVAGDTFTRQLAMRDLFQKGFSAAEDKINAKAMLDALGGDKSEIYEKAINNPKTMDSLKNMLTTIDDAERGHPIADAIISYSNHRLLWMSGALAGLGGGHMGFLGVPGLAAGGVTLTNQMLSKLMENPDTAAFVAKAMKTSVKSPQATAINGALTVMLKGSLDYLGTPDR